MNLAALWRSASVADGYDGLALLALAVDAAELERQSYTAERAVVAGALDGITTKPTDANPDGVSVPACILACNRQIAGKRAGEIKRCGLKCRGRACSLCARRKAIGDGEAMMRFMRIVTGRGGRVLFATLTQPKMHSDDEGVGDAQDRIWSALARLRDPTTIRGRGFRARFKGWHVTVEVTWSAKGATSKDGTQARFSGYHVHLHALLELHDGVDPVEAALWIRDEWIASSPGSRPAAQRIGTATIDHARYVTKYVTKGMELAGVQHVAAIREIYLGTKGRRLSQSGGTWRADKRKRRKGWRELGAEPKGAAAMQPMERGPRIGWAHCNASDDVPGGFAGAPMVFVNVSTREETVARADVVWASVVAHEAARRVELHRRRVERETILAARNGLHVVHPPRPPDPW